MHHQDLPQIQGEATITFERTSVTIPPTAQKPSVLSPADPGFNNLPLPHGQPNPGQAMNREALRRLVLARGAGSSSAILARLYERYKAQIEAAVPGWRAHSARCVDGSYAFIGSKGPALVIMPDGRILKGRFADDGLLRWRPLQSMPDGTIAFPPPDPSAVGTTEVQ